MRQGELDSRKMHCFWCSSHRPHGKKKHDCDHHPREKRRWGRASPYPSNKPAIESSPSASILSVQKGERVLIAPAEKEGGGKEGEEGATPHRGERKEGAGERPTFATSTRSNDRFVKKADQLDPPGHKRRKGRTSPPGLYLASSFILRRNFEDSTPARSPEKKKDPSATPPALHERRKGGEWERVQKKNGRIPRSPSFLIQKRAVFPSLMALANSPVPSGREKEGGRRSSS